MDTERWVVSSSSPEEGAVIHVRFSRNGEGESEC